MGYLNEDGLARYDGLIKNWTTFKSGTVDGIDPLLNWQKTETADAVAFYPLPVAPLDPVVTFTFTETGPAEGTKGPDNPSTITGVSTITVTRCETAGVVSTDYTINLGGTFYGGSVDLSAGTMMVTHVIFEMNGTEWWSSVNNDGETLQAYNSGTGIGYSYCIPKNSIGGLQPVALNSACTHFPVVPTNFSGATVQDGTQATPGFCLVGGGDQFRVAFPFSTLTAWKQWLAGQKTTGTPVKATVKLATPYTVQLTPVQVYSLPQLDPYTPRLNTVYSDQTSVQVGYPKSPQATFTELTNAIVSLGGNI